MRKDQSCAAALLPTAHTAAFSLSPLVETRGFFMPFKRILTFVLAFFVFAASAATFAAPEVNAPAVAYLKGKDPSPWSTMALVAAGETGLSGDHLRAKPGNTAISYMAPTMAIAALGLDPRTFPEENFVAQIQSFWDGTQMGDATTLNDDIFGILALVSAGEPQSDSIIQGIKTFLLANQNQDGGWGFAVNGTSDTNMTAMAIMALVQAGVSKQEPAIQNALSYLKSAQNDDGGFPYDPASPYGTESDASSDAWVISALYALGIDPETWEKNGNNPVQHLKSLQSADGYFSYQAGSPEDAFTPVTTSYAVIALAGYGYPVAVFSPDTPQVRFRIEGSADTICEGKVQAATALDVVINAADQCGYTYEIQDTSFGPYLVRIANDEAAGTTGWMYRVNWDLPSVGAADYSITSSDYVMWYFGEFTWKPLKLSLSDTLSQEGNGVTATVSYRNDDGTWSSAPGAVISAKENSATWTTGNDGTVVLAPQAGSYTLVAEKENTIRSNKETLIVAPLPGSGSAQNVSLAVTVKEDQGEDEDTVSFSVTPSSLNFGNLAAGESAEELVTVANTGTVPLSIQAAVTGDSVFTEGITIQDNPWYSFQTLLARDNEKDVSVQLTIPSTATGGKKEGVLIFWAISQ